MGIKAVLNALIRKIWMLAILVLILLAIYVSLGRVMLPRLQQYHAQIESSLSDALGIPVSFQSLQGFWKNLQPTVSLSGIQAGQAGNEASQVALGSLVMQLDVFRSIWAREPAFSSILVEGLAISLIQNDQGQWAITGADDHAGEKLDSESSQDPAALLRTLMSQHRIELVDANLTFHFTDGKHQAVTVPRWRFNCQRSVCATQGKMIFQARDQAEMDFAINFYGEPGSDDFRVESYVNLTPIHFEDWLQVSQLKLPLSFNFDKFHLGGEVWFTWSGNRPVDIRGSLYAPELQYDPGQDVAPLYYLSAEFTWQADEKSRDLWTLWLNDFTFSWQGEVLEPAQHRWSVSRRDGHKYLNVIANNIDLEFTFNTLLSIESLPDKARDTLIQLRPRGQLLNTHFRYLIDNVKDRNIPKFNLVSNLRDVGVSPWKNAPGGDGVNGYIEVTPLGGRVDFRSEDFRLHFSKLFLHEWRYNKVSGVVRWRTEGKGVWLDSDPLVLSGPSGSVHGRFSLNQPVDGTEPRLDLLLGVDEVALLEAMAYLPEKKTSSGLQKWLEEGVIAGYIDEAAFAYSGSTARGAAPDASSLRLYLRTEESELNYNSDWPHLTDMTSRVDVADKRAWVSIESAHLLQAKVTGMNVAYTPDSKGGQLRIDGQVDGPLASGVKILQDTPLRENLFDLIDDVNAEGWMKVDLGLDVPIDSSQGEIEADVALELDKARLMIPSQALDISNISGSLSYSSREGINAKALNSVFLGHDALINIKTRLLEPKAELKTVSKTEPKAESKTTLTMTSHVGIKELSDWKPNPMLKLLKGDTDYRGQLIFGDREKTRLVVRSNLDGVTVDLPEPFGKSAEQERLLRYTVTLGEDQQHDYIQYGRDIHMALLSEDDEFVRGSLQFGGQRAILSNDDGLRIGGFLPSLNLLAWYDTYQTLIPEEGQAGLDADSGAAPKTTPQTTNGTETSAISEGSKGGGESTAGIDISQVQIKIGRVQYEDEVLEHLAIKAAHDDQGWRVHFDNPVVLGDVFVPSAEGVPVDVDLAHLRLPESEESDADPLLEVMPQDFPAVRFAVSDFRIGKDQFGAWRFNLEPSSEGLRATSIVADTRGLKVNGDLGWSYQDGKHRTDFKGAARIKDVGAAFEAWGFSRSVESSKAKVSGDVAWGGSPAMFSLAGLDGDMKLSSSKGRFAEVEEGAGALRLLGIMNFGSLARRIQFDFSDFKKGVAYDKIKGKFHFDTGMMTMTEPLVIDGPGAKFKVEGSANLIDETFDQDVVVVLPLGGNLSVAAVIVGAPQVGIPLFLINKAFGNLFDQFASARYRVTGPWDEPQFELLKVYEKRVAKENKDALESEAQQNGDGGGAGSGEGTGNTNTNAPAPNGGG